MEITEMSLNRRMGTEDVRYIYNVYVYIVDIYVCKCDR